MIHSLVLIHMFPVLQKWESFLQREQENGQELLTVETDIEKLVDLMIERIEEKRTALGI